VTWKLVDIDPVFTVSGIDKTASTLVNMTLLVLNTLAHTKCTADDVVHLCRQTGVADVWEDVQSQTGQAAAFLQRHYTSERTSELTHRARGDDAVPTAPDKASERRLGAVKDHERMDFMLHHYTCVAFNATKNQVHNYLCQLLFAPLTTRDERYSRLTDLFTRLRNHDPATDTRTDPLSPLWDAMHESGRPLRKQAQTP